MPDVTQEPIEQDRFSCGIAYQKILFQLLLLDPVLFESVCPHIKPAFWDTDEIRWLYGQLTEYYNKYKIMPTRPAWCEIFREKLTKEEQGQYLLTLKSIVELHDIPEKEDVLDHLQKWIKQNLFVRGWEKISKTYSGGKVDEALALTQSVLDECSKVSFKPSDRSFFFADYVPRMAIRQMHFENQGQKISIAGIHKLDDLSGGGLGRGELGVFVADAKVGKSIFLLNVGACAIMQSLSNTKVLHISLEGRKGQVDDRYEARFLLHPYAAVVRNNLPSNAEKRYKQFGNSLVVCNMMDFDRTPLDIVKEIETLATFRFVPDLIIVDYGDLMSPRKDASGNTYLDQQSVYRDLKIIAAKYNVVVWTASQVTRPPVGVDPRTDEAFHYSRYNLADCYAKVRVADMLITGNATDAERDAGKLRLYLDAYRDQKCGQFFHVRTDYDKMQFYVPTVSDFEAYAKSERV
jgi:replicative DNA helicase